MLYESGTEILMKITSPLSLHVFLTEYVLKILLWRNKNILEVYDAYEAKYFKFKNSKIPKIFFSFRAVKPEIMELRIFCRLLLGHGTKKRAHMFAFGNRNLTIKTEFKYICLHMRCMQIELHANLLNRIFVDFYIIYSCHLKLFSLLFLFISWLNTPWW